jgi:hypothetical protein
MKREHGKESLPSKEERKNFGKHSSLEKEILAKLEKSKDGSMLYSELWKGHRGDVFKRELRELEKKGRITIGSERKDMKHVTKVYLIRNLPSEYQINEIIKKFDETNSTVTKRIVIGDGLLPLVKNGPVNSIKILNFLSNCIIKYEDFDLITQLAESLYHIIIKAEEFKIKNILEEFQKLKRNEELKRKLEEIVLNYNNEKILNTRYACSRLLILLDAERSFKDLIEALKHIPLFVHMTGYVQLCIAAYRNSSLNRKETMKTLEEISEGNFPEENKTIARIIISNL